MMGIKEDIRDQEFEGWYEITFLNGAKLMAVNITDGIYTSSGTPIVLITEDGYAHNWMTIRTIRKV